MSSISFGPLSLKLPLSTRQAPGKGWNTPVLHEATRATIATQKAGKSADRHLRIKPLPTPQSTQYVSCQIKFQAGSCLHEYVSAELR